MYGNQIVLLCFSITYFLKYSKVLFHCVCMHIGVKIH